MSFNQRIGILGGGQLGRMLIQASLDWGLDIHVLDPDPHAPCAHLTSRFTVGSLKDYETVVAFGQECDLITIEIEHVNVDALKTLRDQGKTVYPQPEVIELVQDKGAQKQFYSDHDIPTSPFFLLEENATIPEDKLPLVQKSRREGYDGRGVMIINTKNDIKNAFSVPSVCEEKVDVKAELSVIIARRPNGDISAFDPVEMVMNPEANLVDYLRSPAQITLEEEEAAIAVAKRVAEALQHVGVLAVELFLTPQGEILVNEIAPRPHNSGHQTIEAACTSQYEQHIRAILNLHFGETSLVAPSVMINLLGEKGYTGDTKVTGLAEALAYPDVFVHLYGKSQTKPFRKMGHVTILGQSAEEAMATAKVIKDVIKVKA